MALDLDGSKHRMAKKINLRDAIGSKGINGKFSMENPSVVLYYKMQVKVEGDENTQIPERPVSPPLAKKIIKFEDEHP